MSLHDIINTAIIIMTRATWFFKGISL